MPSETSNQSPSTPSTSTAADTLAVLDDRLARKTQINARISTLQDKISDLNDRLGSQQSAAYGMKHELDASATYGTSNKQTIEANYSRATQSINQLTEDIGTLNAELTQLQSVDLPACDVVIDLDVVLEFQHQMDAAQAVSNDIQAAIDVQDKAISDAQATIPDTPNRQYERESILADIAMGKAADADLKALDDQIGQEAKAHEDATKLVATAVSTAQASRSGLLRKLDDSKATVAQMKAKLPIVLRLFLMQEADKEASSYIEAVLQLKPHYVRLRALEPLIKGYGGPSINGASVSEMFIPAFKLPPFDGLQINFAGALMETLYSAKVDAYKNTFQDATTQERERLKQLGVRL